MDRSLRCSRRRPRREASQARGDATATATASASAAEPGLSRPTRCPARGTGDRRRREQPRHALVVSPSSGTPRHAPDHCSRFERRRESVAHPRTPWRKPHETHLPTVEGSPCTHTWLSGSHEDAGRACRDQRATRQGPQATRPVRQPTGAVHDRPPAAQVRLRTRACGRTLFTEYSLRPASRAGTPWRHGRG